MRTPRTLLLAFLIALSAAAPATASISAPETIDGPSGDILEIGGVAMSEDGTGGVTYLKRVDGRARVFAAQFRDGVWRKPQRIDTGQAFDSSWPRIGAGDGGRLVVTWAHEFGAGADRMFSASLDPGASRFQAPVAIDLGIGEATATHPSIAMNRAGQTLLAYRFLPDVTRDPSLPEDYVNADVRLARYNGYTWSVLGQPADRNPSVPVRTPTADNSPRAGIDLTGAGLVAWQEPDDDFVDRIWARRIFGQSFGIPLIVSPQTWGERPLRGPADAFTLDEAGFGQGGIAFRQQPGTDSALQRSRVMLALIPESFNAQAGAFGPARIVDGGGDQGLAAPPGTPSVAVTARTTYLVGFESAAAAFGATGDQDTVDEPRRLDADGTVTGTPAADLTPEGAAALAWPSGTRAREAVTLEERRVDGVTQSRRASVARGGPVEQMLFAGSGLGDALAAFRQGGSGSTEIAAAVLDAPPGPFFVNAGDEWETGREVTVTWDPAPNGIGRVRYDVSVDSDVVVEGVAPTRATLSPADLEDGVHEVEVIATDPGGQATSSPPQQVGVDRRAPRTSLRRAGRLVTVTVTDGDREEVSGAVKRSTTVRWGDGSSTRRRLRSSHRYKRSGVFTITVTTRDAAGNRATSRRRVRVR